MTHEPRTPKDRPQSLAAPAAPDEPWAELRRFTAARLAVHAGGGYDVVFVVADGLSAHAVETHAEPVLALLLPRLVSANWRIAPLVVARHGRVALGDAVAGAPGAEI